jgi:HSP20 family protein
MALNLLPDLILDRPLRQFPNLWSNFPSTTWANLFDEGFFPQEFSSRGTRIYEENNQLHVEVPLPGLNSKDIEVSLNRGVLLVKGESKEEEKDKKRKVYSSSRREYSYSIALPTQIDEKQEPHAVYTDGILYLTLQLAKHGETKKITVKSGTTTKK